MNSILSKRESLFSPSTYVDQEKVKYKINADYLKKYVVEECFREIMVSYIPMLPLLENMVKFEEADYILYMHSYARCDDMSKWVVEQLRQISEKRKDGAEIIVVGKAANAERYLKGKISNITYWGDHFTEKLGKKFGFDIKEQYFVYDDSSQYLCIWPVDGCLQKCKFCRRSFMDIKFESLSLDYIKENLDNIKEINPEMLRRISLRAENLTEYGIDIYGQKMLHVLIDLLDSYDEIEIIDFSIGMSIGEMTPEIVNSICKSKKISGISMNLEAGSDRLLNLIGKKHTCNQALEIFNQIISANPDIEITTGIMIGLPTETLEDIVGLAELIVSIEPDELQCNYYITSPNHPLYKYPQIDFSLREEHLKYLLNILAKNIERPMQIRHYAISDETDNYIKIRQEIDLENEERKNNGLFLAHVGAETEIKEYSRKLVKTLY